MATHTPPPSFAPVPPAKSPAKPVRGVSRRRRVTTLVAVALLVAAIAWIALPSADRGMRELFASAFGGGSTSSASTSGGSGGAVPAAAQDVPFDEDDARQRDDKIDPFDNDHPAIAGLDDTLRDALQAAARDAQDAGVDFWVTSGWRSTAYQQHLLDRAVDRYGSLEEARRFAKTPETSEHVSGQAVDIGPTDGADWTIRKGSRYGLCQTYANEMWHFELATTPGETCPAPEADAAG